MWYQHKISDSLTCTWNRGGVNKQDTHYHVEEIAFKETGCFVTEASHHWTSKQLPGPHPSTSGKKAKRLHTPQEEWPLPIPPQLWLQGTMSKKAETEAVRWDTKYSSSMPEGGSLLLLLSDLGHFYRSHQDRKGENWKHTVVTGQ